MSKVSTYFRNAVLCSLITFLINISALQAQSTSPSLGVSWTSTPSLSEAIEDLDRFEELGIEFIEFNLPVNSAILDSAADRGFDLLIRSELEFLTNSALQTIEDDLIEEFQSLNARFSDYPQVRGLGLYSYSESFSPEFIESMSELTAQLRDSSDIDFYEITTGPFNALDFAVTTITSDKLPVSSGSVLFTKSYTRSDFRTINRLFESQISLILFDADWLLSAVEDYPAFGESLTEYKENKTWVLPLPESEAPSSGFDWLVFIYILIWISVAVHVRAVATYSGLIFRYFTGHRFFVDDIMRYRERSAASGIFLFFQHAAFTGMVATIFSKMFISDKGIEALFHFLPQTALFGQNHFSVFAGGFIIACLIQIIGISWLYFPSKSMNHSSQVLSLYTWSFHLDFLIVSFMLVTYLTGGNTTLILILGVLFVLNWLTAYLLTSLDSSKYLIDKRVSYILYTFGLHTLLNIVLMVLILSSSTILDAIELIVVI